MFNLRTNALRPEGFTSADAAGLPIFPLLARYPEVRAGRIDHALRVTVQRTQRGYIHPATHFASSSSDPSLPPMGLRLRLKAGFSLAGFHGQSLVILRALKRYGLIVADNGSSWYLTGAPDPRWNDIRPRTAKARPRARPSRPSRPARSATAASNAGARRHAAAPGARAAAQLGDASDGAVAPSGAGGMLCRLSGRCWPARARAPVSPPARPPAVARRPERAAGAAALRARAAGASLGLVLLAGDRVLELAHPGAERAPDLGQPPGPEHEQQDENDEQDVKRVV